MKLTCWRMRRILGRYADLESGVPAGTPLAQHLADCRACRNEWLALRRLALDLPLATPQSAVPAGFEQAVWTRIAAAEGRTPRTTGPWIYLALGGATAAGLTGLVHTPRFLAQPAAPLSTAATSLVQHASPSPSVAVPSRKSTRPAEHSNQVLVVPRPTTPPSNHAVAPERTAHTPKTNIFAAEQGEADERFLDGRTSLLFAPRSASHSGDRQLFTLRQSVQDDFILVAPPRLAAGGPNGKAAVSTALKEHEARAREVDARLFRKVTLQLKGASLDELCAALRAQTGVQLTASRGVQDEKVTVFVKDQRARDVMRAVARLFGYVWGRTGEEKAYQYELVQDLRDQLAEEELRNRDKNAALLALDAEMEKLRPYLPLSFEQIKKRWDETGDRLLFNVVIGGGWGGMQLYHRLTPAERAALTSGQELVLRPEATDPDRRLPEEWQSSILGSWSSNVDVQGRLTPIKDVPGIRINQLRLRLDRSELGQTSLRVSMSAEWSEQVAESSTSSERTLATGQSPSVTRPQNAAQNGILRGKAPFDREIHLQPEPSCPKLKLRRMEETESTPHLFSADVWEAVHRETGLPVVADFYTRLYSPKKLGNLHGTLFEVLCQAGDEMGVRWTRDGEFLLARSAGYFWDKLKEVPNRDLVRWRQDRSENGGLSLSSFLQMATMTDQQLESATVTKGIVHCWDLPEWESLGGRPRLENPLVAIARLLGLLTREQQLRALSPSGVAVRELTAPQQRAVLQLWAETDASFERQQARGSGTSPDMVAAAHFVAEYTPAGWWQWTPPLSTPQNPWPRQLAPVTARSEDALRAEVRRLYPEVSGGQIARNPRGNFSGGIRYGPFPASTGASVR